jgi:hypothetical protein
MDTSVLNPTNAEMIPTLFDIWAGWQDGRGEIASLESQLTLSVDLPNGHTVTGTLDALVRTPSGLLVFDERKTSANLQAERLDLDFQVQMYHWLAYEAGLDLGEVWYTIVQKGPMRDRWRVPKTAKDLILRRKFYKNIEGVRRFGQQVVKYVERMEQVNGDFDLAFQTPNPIVYADFGSCVSSCRYYSLCEAEWNTGPKAEQWLRQVKKEEIAKNRLQYPV